MNRYLSHLEDEFRNIDQLFHSMTIRAIYELDWVNISEKRLKERRDRLGIKPYKLHAHRPRLSTGEITRLLSSMGGTMNRG